MGLLPIEGTSIERRRSNKDDFGLKTLTIIKNALELIKQNKGIEIDIDNIPFDDQKTYLLYQSRKQTVHSSLKVSVCRNIYETRNPTALMI